MNKIRKLIGVSNKKYRRIIAENERSWVKFHFKTAQGIECLTPAESDDLIGRDRESNQRDLFEAIEKGDYPKWNMKIQIMTEEQALKTTFNPFDLTKVWPHGEFPLIDAGVLELNRNPDNYFADVEQAAFSPANVVPGIGHSPDKMLQFRIVSYGDAHRYRLGVNYESLPINRPKCEVNGYYRDGKMRFDGNEGGKTNYEPNSYGGPSEDPQYKELPLKIDGDADRYNHRDGNDDYTQAGNLYRLMSADERERLHRAIAGAMAGVPKEIIERQMKHFEKADPAYAAGVKQALT